MAKMAKEVRKIEMAKPTPIPFTAERNGRIRFMSSPAKLNPLGAKELALEEVQLYTAVNVKAPPAVNSLS